MLKKLSFGVLLMSILSLASCAQNISAAISDGTILLLNKSDSKIYVEIIDTYRTKKFIVESNKPLTYYISVAGYREDFSITVYKNKKIVANIQFTAQDFRHQRNIYSFIFESTATTQSGYTLRRERSRY